MKRVFRKLVCTALAAVMTISCAPVAPFGTLSQFAVETRAADGITAQSASWFETAYTEWLPVTNAKTYKAYVKSTSASSYTQLDDELIRQYNTFCRADALGLKAGTYKMKIEAFDSDGKSLGTYESGDITVEAFKRDGFAFSSESPYHNDGMGAYNLDGTLKSDAKVLYITDATKDTITMDVKTNSKGTTTTCTGIGAIIKAREKGYDTTPLAIRFVGYVTKPTSEAKLQLLNVKKTGNITFEGVGNDAMLDSWGLNMTNCYNIEVRNLSAKNQTSKDEDFVTMVTTKQMWIHNNDCFYGGQGSDKDQAKGDGMVDLKKTPDYTTISDNHFWDSGKSSLCGLSETSDYHVTYARNWFDHSDSRHPRIRLASAHVYNNYYDGIAKYGVGMTSGGSAFVEANYFRNASRPMMISGQGTDAAGDGTFSGEDGGIIKCFNNIMVGKYTYVEGIKDGECISGADGYTVSKRSDTLPSTLKAVQGGTSYNNFDTKQDIGVTADGIMDPADVPGYVMAHAGRCDASNFKFTFDDSKDDTDYSVNADLTSALASYSSTLLTIGGTVTTQPNTSAAAGSATGVDGNTFYSQRVAEYAADAASLPKETNGTLVTPATTTTTQTTTNKETTTETTTKTVESSSETTTKTVESSSETTTSSSSNEGGNTSSGYVWNFTTGETSDIISVTGNENKNTVAVNYEGTSLTKSVKFESGSGEVIVNAPSDGYLTLVTYCSNNDSPTLKMSNGSTTDTIDVSDDGAVEIEITKGTYSLKKGSGTTSIYYVEFESADGSFDNGDDGDDGDNGDDGDDNNNNDSDNSDVTTTDGNVGILPAETGSYDFTSLAKEGKLTTDSTYGGAYATANSDTLYVDAKTTGLTLYDTDTTNAETLYLPLGKTYTSGTIVIKGSVTPSVAASKWAYVDIVGDNGSVVKIGTDSNKNNAISTSTTTDTDGNTVNVYKSSTTAAVADAAIEYTATIDLDNKTVSVDFGNDTLEDTIYVTSISQIKFMTAGKATRNLGVGNVTVTYTASLKGDVNGDKTVDSKDAAALLRYLAGIDKSVSANADCDGIDGIDMRDAIWILNFSASSEDNNTTDEDTSSEITGYIVYPSSALAADTYDCNSDGLSTANNFIVSDSGVSFSNTQANVLPSGYVAFVLSDTATLTFATIGNEDALISGTTASGSKVVTVLETGNNVSVTLAAGRYIITSSGEKKDTRLKKTMTVAYGTTAAETTSETTTQTTTSKEESSESTTTNVVVDGGVVNVEAGDTATLLTALYSIDAGDTIDLAPGTYTFDSSSSGTSAKDLKHKVKIFSSNSGTESAHKTLTCSTGEAILDFSAQELDDNNRGVQIDGDYWDVSNLRVTGAGDNGMFISGRHITVTNCVFEGNRDTGLQISYRGSSSTYWPSDIYVKNCTSFNNMDPATKENADGFAAKLTCGENVVFDNCISYCNSDDGWDLFAKSATGPIGAVTIKNCVAFGNGKLTDGSGSASGDMNGFKLGGSGVGSPHVVQNCISFNNGAHGFTDNNNPELASLTNCTSYNNGLYAAKLNFGLDRATSGNLTLSGLISYGSSRNDKFATAEVTNSVFCNNKKYYKIASASGITQDSVKTSGTLVTPSDSDFVSMTVPYTDILKVHEQMRNEDGSINMKGFLQAKDGGAFDGMGAKF